VIDAYNSSPGKLESNPTATFLRKRGVTELAFLAWTHPHADHYYGVLDLLQNFSPKELWQFNGMELFKLMALYEGSKPKRLTNPEEKPFKRLLVQLYTTIAELRRDNKITTRDITLDSYLYKEDDLHIWGLGPSAGQRQRYETALGGCFTTSEHGVVLKRSQEIAPPNHNVISSGFHVQFGNWRAVLGGDILSEGWTDALSQATEKISGANLVKVSHHGSHNGYCAGMWQNLGASGNSIAVVTPFRSKKLPRLDPLRHIRDHTNKIYTTSVPALSDDIGVSQSAKQPTARTTGQGLIERVLLKHTFKASTRPTDQDFGVCSFVVQSDGATTTQVLFPAGEIVLPSTNRRPSTQS
jgi:hypothetical protein